MGLGIAGVAAFALGLALYLPPDPDGHGTHTRLGVPECRWIALFDFPCPTCGMTTAYSHAVRGELWASFFAQPMGFLLAIATGGALLIGLWMMVVGPAIMGLLSRLVTIRLAWILSGILILSWLFKILSVKGFFG